MAKPFVSYLTQLRFDPQLARQWNAKYLQNTRIILLIILTILAVGMSALFNLPKRLNPEVKLTIVRVITVMPGSAPADVESLVTDPLEEKLLGVKGLDTITSSSLESVSAIVMQFKSGIDKDKARTDVQTAVSEVTNLPADAQQTKVEAVDFEDRPIWSFAITTSMDTASLMRYADTLKKKIKDLPNVDSVSVTGGETQEIQVAVYPEKIRQYGLNPFAVSQALKTATHAFPAGSVETDTLSFSLSLEAQANAVDDIRGIVLSVAGQPVRLGDIASVSERSKPNQAKTFLTTKAFEKRRAVTLSVYKTSTADIDTTVKSVEAFVHGEIGKTDGRFQVTSITNAGEQITKQFADLFDEFKSTLVLVFINLLLFLGVRQALISSITIPLTFLLSFAWMSMLGQTLNFVTLFSLLLAFGTSIDDTIVTVSSMTAYYRTGKFTALETGLLVWRDIVVPIWTTTITTVWAFLPLILTTGLIGEFIRSIPIVVATTMYSSTAVAWFVTLPMIIVLLHPKMPKRIVVLGKVLGAVAVSSIVLLLLPKTALFPVTVVAGICLVLIFLQTRSAIGAAGDSFIRSNAWIIGVWSFFRHSFDHGIINIRPIERKYQQTISRVVSSPRGRRAALTIVAVFAVSAYLLVPLGLVKNEFFPKSNEDLVYVSLELPAGSTLPVMDDHALAVLSLLKGVPQTKSVTAQTRTQLGTNGAITGGDHSVLFTVTLDEKETRTLSSTQIAGVLRKKLQGYSAGKISVTELSGGPPAGADVQLKLTGDGLLELNRYASALLGYLKTIPGVVNADLSVKSGTSKLIFKPDQTKLAAAGISLDSLGFWLRTSASGFGLDKVKFGTSDTMDVTFYTTDGTLHPEDISSVNIPTATGYVPLASLGTVAVTTNPTVITREEGKRTISVVSDVLPGYSSGEINNKLIEYARTKLNLADGYEWKTGGVNEENAKSVASIFRAMGLSFILIMATMVIEFQSYRQAAMILSLIPLAISGVFWIFGLTGTPLSFPALIGVLALFGVVVTNAMFIVEKINQNRQKGMDLVHAISDAGQSRLEPIILTSLTSILGLVPITIANPLWRGLGGAIISGLLFSGGIMLLYIPVMYYIIYRDRRSE